MYKLNPQLYLCKIPRKFSAYIWEYMVNSCCLMIPDFSLTFFSDRWKKIHYIFIVNRIWLPVSKNQYQNGLNCIITDGQLSALWQKRFCEVDYYERQKSALWKGQGWLLLMRIILIEKGEDGTMEWSGISSKVNIKLFPPPSSMASKRKEHLIWLASLRGHHAQALRKERTAVISKQAKWNFFF